MTIKHFSIEYDAINNKNTFTNGDTMNGRIIVEVSKETEVNSIIFTGQGRAEVCWSEHYGQHHQHVYRAVEKYYNVKHHILRGARQDGVLSRGRHVFPFCFNIPDRKMPSTFKDSVGKIVHKVTAELKQSMKLTQKTKAHFNFVSKADIDIPGLMNPQDDCKTKPINVFGSGAVSLNIQIDRMGYEQGQDVEVRLHISNQSTRPVKPKFILYEKKSYFAQGRRKVVTHVVLKDKTEVVPSCSEEIVTKVISIPRELPPSIMKSSVFRLEYRLKLLKRMAPYRGKNETDLLEAASFLIDQLQGHQRLHGHKVHLDIKWAVNPELKLPIVVLPGSAGFGFEVFGRPNPTPFMASQQQAADQPPAYGEHTMYPLFSKRSL